MSTRKVYKSSAAEFLDDFFGGSGTILEFNLGYGKRLLDTHREGPLSEVSEQFGRDNVPQEFGTAADFEAFWLADASRLGGKNVDRVMRYGYEEAIRIASGHDPQLRIETLWVTGAGDDFEVHICEGKRQVTVLMFIPLARHYGSKHAKARSWVIRAGGPIEEGEEILHHGDPPVVKVQVSGPRESGA
jgi:hypothetical protein